MNQMVQFDNFDVKVDGNGRYSLNDLHKITGGKKNDGPSYWLQTAQAQKLISELVLTTGFPVVKKTEGRYGGTYAVKALAIAYAQWISAEFHLRVISVFERYASADVTLAADIAERADPEKADLYKDFAAALYGISKDEVSKAQRQVGKVAHLGLGFGAGAATFQKVAKLMGGVDITLDESRDIVAKWRRMYGDIATGWKTCHAALKNIHLGVEEAIDPWGLCFTCKEGIRTPKGLIRYPGLREEFTEDGKSEWVYGEGRNKARIYAGKVTENIVQHLARCVIADNALDYQRQTGRTPALTVHDELVYVVPETEAEQALADLQKLMRTPPSWWPELVVHSEGDIADTYGAAK